MSPTWVDTPAAWDRTARRLWKEAESGRPTGLDTEFTDVHIRKQSPVARSRLCVWSVAVYDGGLSPRGYRTAVSVGLPESAADHPALRAWLESSAPKVAHNSPAEAHTFGNRGITVGGLINSLSLARFMAPGRLSYGLDGLGVDLLGEGKAEWDWTRPKIVTVERRRKERKCECGTVPCRRQQKTPGHRRLETEHVWSEDVARGREDRPIREIVPGHPDWAAWLEYFTRDARLALSLYSALERLDRRVPNPWERGGTAEVGLLPKLPGRSVDLWGEEIAA